MNGGRLQGRVALVTGASRNIGRAIALAFAAEGADGSIIALGGMSSLTGRPNTAVVTVAKTGLLGLVRALAAELGPFGIRVNMVMPGFIDTERRHAEWYPEFRQSPPGSSQKSSRRSRSGASAGGRTSRTRACSSRPTRRPTSPATRSA